VNLEIARAGWADPLTIPPNVRYTSAYVSAVQQARTSKLGMWSEIRPATSSVNTPSTSAPSEYDCPKDRPIKGNIWKDGTRLYHVPGDSSYKQTKPEKCFATRQEAEANRFRPARPAR
jgi:micrococcal nuclease